MTHLEEMIMQMAADIAVIKSKLESIPDAAHLEKEVHSSISRHVRDCPTKKGASKLFASLAGAITAIAGALVAWLASR